MYLEDKASSGSGADDNRVVFHALPGAIAAGAGRQMPPDFKAGFSPEALFLLGLVAADSSPHTPAASCRSRAFDWSFVVESAEWHGLIPLLHRLLNESGSLGEPEWARQRVREKFYANAFRSIRLTRELVRLASLFASHGIEAIALKGPVVAMLAYGHVAMRQFCDIDILVRRADIARADELLSAQGYQAVKNHNGFPVPDRFTGVSKEYRMPAGQEAVDLQWSLSPRCFPFKPRVESLFERKIPIEADGAELSSLSLEDLLVYLCAHGAKHGWVRLAWIADVARVVSNHPELNWDTVLARTSETKSRRILLLGLLLAHRLTGLPLPERVLGAVSCDSTLCRLAVAIVGRLFGRVGVKPSLFQDWAVPLLSIEGCGRRLEYLWLRAMVPTFEDWLVLPMPPAFDVLYFLIRPVRLLSRHGARLFRDVPTKEPAWR